MYAYLLIHFVPWSDYSHICLYIDIDILTIWIVVFWVHTHRPAMTTLKDGRNVCSDCTLSVILDETQARPIYDEVAQYFSSLGMHISQLPPLLLVDMWALNEELRKEEMKHCNNSNANNNYHHSSSNHRHGESTTRGLTLSEEIVTTTTRYYRHRPSGLGSLSRAFGLQEMFGRSNNNLRGSQESRQQQIAPGDQVQTRHTEVSAVLILFGLPRVLTGAIIAHELMHVYLRLSAFRQLPSKVEEGLCQLTSYMWICPIVDNLDGYEKDSGEYFKVRYCIYIYIYYSYSGIIFSF